MLSVALAGKPNAGKSTFYKAATMADVDIGNYPFTTIDPNRGVTHVRTDCPCLDREQRCGNENCRAGKRYVPVELLDVAGLVPGAHEGKGLGNQFLTDLNEADVLVHVVDFTGETDLEGEPTEDHDPRADIDFLEGELDMWYLDILEKGIERYRSGYHGNEKAIEEDLAEQMSAFDISAEEIKQVVLALDLELDPDTWSDADRETLAREIRIRTKPMLIAANKMDTPEAQANWKTVTTDDEYDHLTFVPTSAHAEKALKNADEGGVVEYTPGDDEFDIVGDLSEQQEQGLDAIAGFVSEYGGTGVQRAIERALFDVLGVIPVFPGSANGKSEEAGAFRDCFLLPDGSTTADFAHHIHSDIGDGLLHGIDCRTERQGGGSHVLDERDVIELITTA